MRDYKIHNAGDGALVIEFGDRIDPFVNESVLNMSNRLDAQAIVGIVETVPTFRSLMVHYDPLVLPREQLISAIEGIVLYEGNSAHVGMTWSLPVCYDPRVAEDLEYLSQYLGISQNQLIEAHSSKVYSVYMLGFLPGQPYLGDLADELHVPRRNNPRMKIPAGSVGIATSLTCIFPRETPCGWHIIGRTPVNLWKQEADPRPLLAPGDRVAFEPISFRKFEELSARGAEGLLALSSRTEEAMA
jgi:inhibitor of KinA